MKSLSVKVTVRIPKSLREEMDRFSHVNWSDVIRKAVATKVREEKIKWALTVMEDVSSKAKPERAMEEVVREFRDRPWRPS